MSGRIVLFVNSGGYEVAWQAASLGITAAAMGNEVTFVVAFEALTTMAKGDFGKPLNERERAEATRGEGMGAQSPWRMVQEARAMGARVVACHTIVKLCGLTSGELAESGAIDEVLGLPQIYRLMEGARVLTF